MLREYYKAARDDAALVEKDWYGIVRLDGSERVSWLQGMITNDVEKLSPGQGCYAGHLSPQGKMIAHMLALRDADALWLVMERAAIPGLISAFDKLLIMEDVQVADTSDTMDIVGVVGPRAAGVLESWLEEPLNLSGLYSHRAIGEFRVVVTNLGYDVWVRRAVTDKVLRALALSGATPIDRGTWDVLRTELGWPIYGVDIDESTTMPELGEHGISYDKGCYVGQEVVAKIKYIGHVNRRFVGLTIDGEVLPKLRSPIVKEGRDVGYITTTLFSPGLNKPIALGFVSRAAYAAGTTVHIVSDGRAIPASIVDLPFSPRSAD